MFTPIVVQAFALVTHLDMVQEPTNARIQELEEQYGLTLEKADEVLEEHADELPCADDR